MLVWLDLDHKEKFVEKNSKIEKIEISEFECIPLFYVILLCLCSEYQPWSGWWLLSLRKGDLYRKLLAVINAHSNYGRLTMVVLFYCNMPKQDKSTAMITQFHVYYMSSHNIHILLLRQLYLKFLGNVITWETSTVDSSVKPFTD